MITPQGPFDLGIVVALQEEFRELLGLCGDYEPPQEADLDSYLFERGASGRRRDQLVALTAPRTPRTQPRRTL